MPPRPLRCRSRRSRRLRLAASPGLRKWGRWEVPDISGNSRQDAVARHWEPNLNVSAAKRTVGVTRTGGRIMTTSEAIAPATDTRTVVRSYFEAVGRADRNAQTDWYADDASGQIYGVIGPAGTDEMRSFFHDLFDAFPDFKLEILDLVVDDDRAAVRWRATGTFNGSRSFQGPEPTGRDIEDRGGGMG